LHLLGANAWRRRHKWVRLLNLEEFCSVLHKHSRSKRAEGLASLDACKPILHLSVARISQYRAIAERTRTHLETTMKIAHDPSGVED
jgi:hypothetical protein